jgi:hypothetical protein
VSTLLLLASLTLLLVLPQTKQQPAPRSRTEAEWMIELSRKMNQVRFRRIHQDAIRRSAIDRINEMTTEMLAAANDARMASVRLQRAMEAYGYGN